MSSSPGATNVAAAVEIASIADAKSATSTVDNSSTENTDTKPIDANDSPDNQPDDPDDIDDDEEPPLGDTSTALASETTSSEQDDEFQRKLETDVNNLIDDDAEGFDERDEEFAEIFDGLSLAAGKDATNSTEQEEKAVVGDIETQTIDTSVERTSSVVETPKVSATASNEPTAIAVATKMERAFIYTLPSDVIKTAYNRHQRGMMDARLYQLLTKKEIVLQLALEDEQYRDVPSVHLFYRRARQMIYAILFNLNHQKYIHSRHPTNVSQQQQQQQQNSTAKTTAAITTETMPSTTNNANNTANTQVPSADTTMATTTKSRPTKSTAAQPQIAVNEWLWSPQNEYKQPDVVLAVSLGWAVPTIQRLWFGTQFEDKQRRMKAFLSVMRSDTPLMLNRDYVPQHMLTMACVLRYIVTHPERTVVSRQELDAFLATAFAPHIVNVEYTQELVVSI